MILYSMGRDLISDVPARRETMRLFTNFYNQKTIILSMIEWVDAFGANTLTLTDRLVALDSEMEGAIDDYLEQDYPAAISFLQSVTDTAKEISRDVVRLKDEALLWIYLVEWLAVSGTTVVSAFVIWSLMVRKRAYKEIKTTRFET
jgi:UTP:GlnB (protein PII) uridylyltransferase